MTRRKPMRPVPAQAKAHDAGATIEAVQVLEHERLGVVGYLWPRFWGYHFNAARTRRLRLAELHEEIARLEPRDGSKSRLITDHQVLGAVYETAVEMVKHSVLTLRHFLCEVERVIEHGTTETDDLQRLREAAAVAGLSDPATREGWDALGELIERRHAIEHPRDANVYSAEAWEQVPLAWALTQRALDVFDAFDEVFDALAQEWDVQREGFARPTTLLGVQRGMTAVRSPAKPPPRAHGIEDETDLED